MLSRRQPNSWPQRSQIRRLSAFCKSRHSRSRCFGFRRRAAAAAPAVVMCIAVAMRVAAVMRMAMTVIEIMVMHAVRRQVDDVAMAHAALGDDVIGEVLDI